LGATVLISYELDDDSTAMDPLGAIRIAGDDAREIRCNNTFLDVWFTALCDAIKSPLPASIDLVDEPEPLNVAGSSGNLLISYGVQNAAVSSKDQLTKAVHAAARQFLNDVRSRTADPLPQILRELEERVNGART
jgi:hypothetical protein